MTPDSPEVVMQRRYSNLFGTPEGRLVLGDILIRGHFGVTLDYDNKAQVAEYNSALIIAHMAGALDLIYPQLGIPVKEKK